MKQWNTKLWVKLLCLALSILFISGGIFCAAWAVVAESELGLEYSQWTDTGYAYTVLELYRDLAVEKYAFEQTHPDLQQLDYLEEQTYTRLQNLLTGNNTNFRYQLLDHKGSVLVSNLGQDVLQEQVPKVYQLTLSSATLTQQSEAKETDSDSTYSNYPEMGMYYFGNGLYRDMEGNICKFDAWGNMEIVAFQEDDASDLKDPDEYYNPFQWANGVGYYFYNPYGQAVSAATGQIVDLPDQNTGSTTAPASQSETQADSYILEYGVATAMPLQDALWYAKEDVETVGGRVIPMLSAAVVLGLLGLAFAVLYLAAAGHKAGVEGIHLNLFHRIPFSVVLLVAMMLGCLVIPMVNVMDRFDLELGRNWSFYIYRLSETGSALEALEQLATANRVAGWNWFSLACAGISAWLFALVLGVFSSLVVQLKAHRFLKSTLCYRLFLWGKGTLSRLFRAVRLFWKAILVLAALFFAFFFCIVASVAGAWPLAILLYLALGAGSLFLLLRWCRGWEQVQTGCRAIAAGDLNYQIKTELLPGSLQSLGQNLNSISNGLESAVRERSRSDRFRAELITNVSHDLKTPLTSIINYVDLLEGLQLEDPKAREYLEVLARKSQRLKVLTEDLVEASKASTGSLTVNAQKMNLCQLVRQALGEYEEKLTAAGLTLRSSFAREKIPVQADGSHMWRVLDNLLSNCVKYAMPGSRVYVDVDCDGVVAWCSVKNMSADPLNIPAQELMERFVRGDASRSTEGSGLGLSIAQNLVHLQGGSLKVEVDGDLFKATVQLPALQDGSI